MKRKKRQPRKNNLIKDLISVILFSYFTYASVYELPNVNQMFFYFIITGLIFFIVSSIYEIIKIYPSLKTMIKSREKIDVSNSFKWNYFMFLVSIGIIIISVILLCSAIESESSRIIVLSSDSSRYKWITITTGEISTLNLILSCMGMVYGFYYLKQVCKHKDDLNTIDYHIKRMVKKLVYRIEF